VCSTFVGQAAAKHHRLSVSVLAADEKLLIFNFYE